MEILASPFPPFHPIVEKIFLSRNIDGDKLTEFFSEDLRLLPPLTSLLDVDKGARRIIQAIEDGQSIGVHGDYDVDGTTSCALLYRFFNLLQTPPSPPLHLYQPHRMNEGYGLHRSSIDKACKDGVNLLITVDCGITNGEAALYAKKKKLDLIITDHHKDGAPEMPQALAVINPNRRDEHCDPQLKCLAGVGVAFALCLRVRELIIETQKSCPSLYPLLPYVAMGTLCDMVPLNPMNLKLVRHGLQAIKTSSYEGVKKLFPPSKEKKK